MKEVTKYVADDGTVFETANEALGYEQLLGQLAEVDALLRPVPDTIAFANGEGYVQQDPAMISSYRDQLSKITESAYGLIAISLSRVRYVADPGNDPHAKALGVRRRRLDRIDTQYREWGQPYYAMHPEEGKQVEVQHASETD